VLDQTGPFIAVVFAALLDVAFWGGILVLLDRRSQRPLAKCKDEKGVPRWLPRGSTEARRCARRAPADRVARAGRGGAPLRSGGARRQAALCGDAAAAVPTST
jgi:hypothetical protein